MSFFWHVLFLACPFSGMSFFWHVLFLAYPSLRGRVTGIVSFADTWVTWLEGISLWTYIFGRLSLRTARRLWRCCRACSPGSRPGVTPAAGWRLCGARLM